MGHLTRYCLGRLPQGLSDVKYNIVNIVNVKHIPKTSDDPKYRAIFEGAILHDQADDKLLDMIRSKNHVYIEWKTNLQWLMKQDFLKTNSCDLSLGELMPFAIALN